MRPHDLIKRRHLFIGVERTRAAPVVFQIIDSPCRVSARVLLFVTIGAFVTGARVLGQAKNRFPNFNPLLCT